MILRMAACGTGAYLLLSATRLLAAARDLDALWAEEDGLWVC
jgi:hypothetical protein